MGVSQESFTVRPWRFGGMHSPGSVGARGAVPEPLHWIFWDAGDPARCPAFTRSQNLWGARLFQFCPREPQSDADFTFPWWSLHPGPPKEPWSLLWAGRRSLPSLTYAGASSSLVAREPASCAGVITLHCAERLTTQTPLIHTFFSCGSGVLCSYLRSCLLVPKRGSALHWLKMLYLEIISAHRKVSNTRLEPKAHKAFTQILLLLIFCTFFFFFIFVLVLSLYLVYINKIIIHCFFLNHLFIHHDELIKFIHHMGFPGSLAQPVKNLPAVQKSWVRSLCQEDSPGEGNGYPLQYSSLENSMDRAWRATVHRVAKSWTWLSN